MHKALYATLVECLFFVFNSDVLVTLGHLTIFLQNSNTNVCSLCFASESINKRVNLKKHKNLVYMFHARISFLFKVDALT